MPALAFALLCAGILIFLGVRFYFGIAFVLDKKFNPWRALVASFKVTQANFWRLVVISLLQMGLVVIAALLLGIGLIWALPFCFILYGVLYQILANGLFNS